MSRAWGVFLLLLASRVAFVPFSSYYLFDFHFRAFLAHTLVRCFRVSISYFLWNFVTYLHRKHILVSLFLTIRGLDRKIPSVSVFLYLRLMKLAPSLRNLRIIEGDIVRGALRGSIAYTNGAVRSEAGFAAGRAAG